MDQRFAGSNGTSTAAPLWPPSTSPWNFSGLIGARLSFELGLRLCRYTLGPGSYFTLSHDETASVSLLPPLEVHDRSGEGQLLLAVIFLTGAVILWGTKDDPLGPQYPAGLEVDFYTPQDVELASGSRDAEPVTELHQLFL